MSTTIPQTETRSLHDLCELAARVPCGRCWANPTVPCTVAGPPGYHMARFAAARHEGLISEADMAAVLEAAGDVFTPATVIRDGAR